MAENQILQFAYGGSANVIDQNSYAADAQRINGHQPGIARSALENKALRQCSTMAAGLAQFVADNQGANVVDWLTPSELSVMLRFAVGAAVPYASTDTNGVVQFATAAEVAAGTPYVAITPAELPAAFPSINGQNGYTKLPNGLIIQWGMKYSGASYDDYATFPMAFPNACFTALVAPYGELSLTEARSCTLNSVDAYAVRVLKHSIIGNEVTASSGSWSYIAIGY